MTDAAMSLRARLVDELSVHGWLTSQAWREAFTAVPRHLFLPRFFALTPDGAAYVAIDEQHPHWLEMVYRNTVWPTQLDADPAVWQRARDHGPITGTATCSSTQPSLMAIMLEGLDVSDGRRVLEIGTGTGYNAALIAYRLGGEQVVSVDIDAGLIAQAQANLQRAGYTPGIATADGKGGHAPGAFYDRLIATCSVAAIPPAWIEQVKPGGVIVANLYRQLVGHSLVRLTVADDGTARGTLLDDAGGFMPLRAHEHPGHAAIIRQAMTQDGDRRPSTLPGPLTEDGAAWMQIADLIMAGVARTHIIRDRGDVQWLTHSDGSWAYHDISTGDVEQGGPRHLWDHLEHLYGLWAGNGCPTRDQIGVTITTAGEQQVWLTDPMNIVELADITEPRGAEERTS